MPSSTSDCVELSWGGGPRDGPADTTKLAQALTAQMTTLSSGREVSRSRAGSSRADFVGVEPVSGALTPSPSGSRRQSHVLNSPIQHLYEEWYERQTPYLTVEQLKPHFLNSTGSQIVDILELGGPGARESFSVLFPWMHVTVRCGVEVTLALLKKLLFQNLKAMAHPGYSQNPEDYIFRARCTAAGDKIEMCDLFREETPIHKIEFTHPFPILFLYEPVGFRTEKDIAKGIGQALGFPLKKMESLLTEQLKEYRIRLFKEVEQTLASRGQGGYQHYAFPEDKQINNEEACPNYLDAKIKSASLSYRVFYRTRDQELANSDDSEIFADIEFQAEFTPSFLISKVLEELREIGPKHGIKIEETPSDVLLQVAGQKCYLTGNSHLLINYGSVRSALEDYRTPKFVLRRREIVLRDYPSPGPMHKPAYVRAGSSALVGDENQGKTMSLWDVDSMLRLRPLSCSNLGSSDAEASIYVCFGVYCGKSLLISEESCRVPAHNPRWQVELLNLEVYMKDLPPAAFLSISLIEERIKRAKQKSEREDRSESEDKKKPEKTERKGDSAERKKRSDKNGDKSESEDKKKEKGDRRGEGTSAERKKSIRPALDIEELSLNDKKKSDASKKDKENEERPRRTEKRVLGWVNLRLFDWQEELLQGVQTFSLWTEDKRGANAFNELMLNPEAPIGLPDNKSNCPRLKVELQHWDARVRLPEDEMHMKFVETQIRWGTIKRKPDPITVDSSDMQKLTVLLRKHLIGKEALTKEEEELVWDIRYTISEHIPDALVLLAECDVTWSQREKFAELYVMLKEWKPLSIGAALVLLGKRIMDKKIRGFAVEQLELCMDNQTFPLFILPLVQALKCEQWSCSELSLLLLRRALSDYRVGHKLFWTLRAELIDSRDADGNVTEASLRLALIIEAYLRGNEEHIKTVVKQVSMVERLTKLSVMVKQHTKDAATKKLREELKNNLFFFENMDSPLDPTNSLGKLIVDSCRVLSSAKMPLRLCWANVNPLSKLNHPVYEIIFKNGDDLRQDMLVLQVLELVDAIWKKSDMDCCLSPYPVLPMGTKIGMIGVVPNCCTIFEIQSEGGKMGTAVKSLETTFINKYLRNQAVASRDYLDCVDRFLYSTVGYSVTTFVMGIKDRHNDNIMMTKDGKLFHIDFGHILGHGKTKLGIQRDRVPFVLTEHFLCVIGKGKPVTKESHEMHKFKQLCIDAYLLLWEARSLFISLFTVMQGMHLPELSTSGDLEYLKKALCVEAVDEKDAEKYFSDVFEEAFNGSWATKTNWFFHTVKHL